MPSPVRGSQLWSQFESSEHMVQKLLQQAQGKGKSGKVGGGQGPVWGQGQPEVAWLQGQAGPVSAS